MISMIVARLVIICFFTILTSFINNQFKDLKVRYYLCPYFLSLLVSILFGLTFLVLIHPFYKVTFI